MLKKLSSILKIILLFFIIYSIFADNGLLAPYFYGLVALYFLIEGADLMRKNEKKEGLVNIILSIMFVFLIIRTLL